jgi:hypothetical protein
MKEFNLDPMVKNIQAEPLAQVHLTTPATNHLIGLTTKRIKVCLLKPKD